MKKCPKCRRTYEDDSLIFCLEDGARLTAVDELAATLLKSSQPLDPPATEILPTGWTQSNEPPRTIKAVVPVAYTQRGTTDELHEKKASNFWIITGGALLVVVIGGALAGLGYWAWRKNEQQTVSPSATGSNAPSVNNAPANTNPSPATNVSDAGSVLSWLNGTWTGVGYQTDTKTKWKVSLTVNDGSYAVAYPDIPCRGKWSMNEKNSKGASFTESITQGRDRCSNNSQVLVEKINDSEISCRYSHAGSRQVIATVVLSKKF